MSSKEFLRIEAEELESWKNKIVEYLLKGTLPIDREKARKLRTQATRYVMIADKLYRRGFSSLMLKCLNKEQTDYVIKELHEGIYGMHLGGR